MFNWLKFKYLRWKKDNELVVIDFKLRKDNGNYKAADAFVIFYDRIAKFVVGNLRVVHLDDAGLEDGHIEFTVKRKHFSQVIQLKHQLLG